MLFFGDSSLGCLYIFVPISAIAIILSAVAGWRLSRASRPNPLSRSELFLLRSLRLNLYEPLITSSYVLVCLFVIDLQAIVWQLRIDVPDVILMPFLLLWPMLLLLLPLRLIRSTEPHLRSYSSKLLGLSVLRILLTLATGVLFVPLIVIGVAVLFYSIHKVAQWHDLIVYDQPYKPLSVGQQGVLVSENQHPRDQIRINL